MPEIWKELTLSPELCYFGPGGIIGFEKRTVWEFLLGKWSFKNDFGTDTAEATDNKPSGWCYRLDRDLLLTDQVGRQSEILRFV